MKYINRIANFKKRFVSFLTALPIGCIAGALITGCRLVEKAAELPIVATQSVLSGFAADEQIDQVELQGSLLRFAADFMTTVTPTVEKL